MKSINFFKLFFVGFSLEAAVNWYSALLESCVENEMQATGVCDWILFCCLCKQCGVDDGDQELAPLGYWLDSMIIQVFFQPNDSVSLGAGVLSL